MSTSLLTTSSVATESVPIAMPILVGQWQQVFFSKPDDFRTVLTAASCLIYLNDPGDKTPAYFWGGETRCDLVEHSFISCTHEYTNILYMSTNIPTNTHVTKHKHKQININAYKHMYLHVT